VDGFPDTEELHGVAVSRSCLVRRREKRDRERQAVGQRGARSGIDGANDLRRILAASSDIVAAVTTTGAGEYRHLEIP
jgi:hypothetical protein